MWLWAECEKADVGIGVWASVRAIIDINSIGNNYIFEGLFLGVVRA